MKEAVPHQVDRLSSLREQLGKREGLTLTRAISRLSSLQGLIFLLYKPLRLSFKSPHRQIPITSPTILCLPLPDLTCTLSYRSVTTTTPLPPPHPLMSPPCLCPYPYLAQHPLASFTSNQDPITDPCSALPTPSNQTTLLRRKTVKFRIKIRITFPIPFLSSLLKRHRSKSSLLR